MEWSFFFLITVRSSSLLENYPFMFFHFSKQIITVEISVCFLLGISEVVSYTKSMYVVGSGNRGVLRK